MKEAVNNMINVNGDAIVVTTNGFVKANGECVMGRGIAMTMADLYPMLPKMLGSAIKQHGNRVHLFNIDGRNIITFPVKPITGISDGTNFVSHKSFPVGAIVPGWAMKADPQIIMKSAHELVELVNSKGYKTVICPQFGCGAGELKWKDIKSMLADVLDDRFTAYTLK